MEIIQLICDILCIVHNIPCFSAPKLILDLRFPNSLELNIIRIQSIFLSLYLSIFRAFVYLHICFLFLCLYFLQISLSIFSSTISLSNKHTNSLVLSNSLAPSLPLFLYLSVSLSLPIPFTLFFCLSIFLYLSIYLSPSLYLFIPHTLSLYQFPSFFLSIYLTIAVYFLYFCLSFSQIDFEHKKDVTRNGGREGRGREGAIRFDEKGLIFEFNSLLQAFIQ